MLDSLEERIEYREAGKARENTDRIPVLGTKFKLGVRGSKFLNHRTLFCLLLETISFYPCCRCPAGQAIKNFSSCSHFSYRFSHQKNRPNGHSPPCCLRKESEHCTHGRFCILFACIRLGDREDYFR